LALRLAVAGVDVVMGSRSAERAADVCDELRAKWPEADYEITPGDNAAAAEADIVVVATPWDAAASTAGSVAASLDGKVVVSMANALARVGKEFEPLVPPRGSVAAHVQSALPKSFVAAALHHVPARSLGDLNTTLEGDVLVCSDHPEALKVTVGLVRRLPGLRPLIAGSLSNAAPIEAFTAVLLELNTRYRAHTALRIIGVDGE
jgi:NADPH-dependent F420 reductase